MNTRWSALGRTFSISTYSRVVRAKKNMNTQKAESPTSGLLANQYVSSVVLAFAAEKIVLSVIIAKLS